MRPKASFIYRHTIESVSKYVPMSKIRKSPIVRKPSRKRSTERFNITEVKGKRSSTWLLSGYLKSGERIRQKFKDLSKAQSTKQALDNQELNGKPMTVTELTEEQVKDAQAALQLLGGVSSLTDAASFFKERYEPLKAIPLRDAITRYLGDKEDDQLSDHTLIELKSRLSLFETYLREQKAKEVIDREAKKVSEEAKKEILEGVASPMTDSITSDDVADFLKQKKYSGRSRNNHRGKLSSFFLWAIENKLASENPVKKTKAVKKVGNNPDILSVPEAAELLRAARDEEGGELYAFVSIGVFCGLRPASELQNLTWDHVNLEDGEISVPEEGKTGRERQISIPKNLQLFLEDCDRTKPIYPTNFRRKFAAVKRACGYKGGVTNSARLKKIDKEEGRKAWQPDLMRHTFISYHVRHHENLQRTATIAGNSGGIIVKHYRASLTKRNAKAFWDITPKTLEEDNLVDIKSA